MLNDIKWSMKMIRSNKVYDDDGRPVAFWEKLWVAVLVICGIIVVEHEYRS